MAGISVRIRSTSVGRTLEDALCVGVFDSKQRAVAIQSVSKPATSFEMSGRFHRDGGARNGCALTGLSSSREKEA
jgi:hypothetical protein